METKGIINEAQLLFLKDKLSKYNLACVTVHGSTLYGLNHAESDVDIKAVYLPSKVDLLMGNSLKNFNYKNDDLGVEIEIKSLPSFITSLGKCDTNCLDMIHTSDNMTLLSTPLWEGIRSLRSCVYAKNMKGILGYIRTHTHKYSNKIQRLEELTKLQNFLSSFDTSVDIKNYSLKQSCLSKWLDSNSLKYIKLGTIHSDHEQEFLEVCGKKYTMTWSVETVLDAVSAEIKRYGKRTNSGSDVGMDLKALSHALRALVEVEDLVVNREISFPLKEVELVRKVKFGGMVLDEIIELIEQRFDKVNELIDQSDLPEFNDLTPMLNILEGHYFGKHN